MKSYQFASETFDVQQRDLIPLHFGITDGYNERVVASRNVVEIGISYPIGVRRHRRRAVTCQTNLRGKTAIVLIQNPYVKVTVLSSNTLSTDSPHKKRSD
jgi:hypothetical protein